MGGGTEFIVGQLRDVTTPLSFQWQFIIRRLAIAMINLHTKFEVSVFTHYDYMKGNAKCRNWEGLQVLGVTQGHR